METRLLSCGRVRGWCFGAWGEASQEVHGLVQLLAKKKLQVAPTEPGRRGPARSREAQLASLVASVRRDLSCNAVKQQSKLLLDRLRLLGDGATEAANRRGWAVQLERVAARERRAQDACLRQGQAVRRHGFGKLH